MKPQQFDLAIIGAGAAGLQLLYEYYQLPENAHSSVLLIDSGDRSKKSWCFWAEAGQESFPFLIEKSWPKISYRSSENKLQTEEIGSLAYHYISSSNYYKYFFEQFIPQHPHITVVQGWVEALGETEKQVQLKTREGHDYEAMRVADSRIMAKEDHQPCHIHQHFLGKFIEFEEGILDDSSVTMMDFSQTQTHKNFTAFHYILPFSSTSALIETTVFSQENFDQVSYDALWEKYMLEHYPNQKYTIRSIEIGTIPMCVSKNRTAADARIFRIGTASGQVKSSTGYAFTRMHRDARNKVLHHANHVSSRFAFYDTILLQMIKSENKVIPQVMDRLFEKTSFEKILRFLDEKTNLWEEVSIFCRLNIPLFLKHLVKTL